MPLGRWRVPSLTAEDLFQQRVDAADRSLTKELESFRTEEVETQDSGFWRSLKNFTKSEAVTSAKSHLQRSERKRLATPLAGIERSVAALVKLAAAHTQSLNDHGPREWARLRAAAAIDLTYPLSGYRHTAIREWLYQELANWLDRAFVDATVTVVPPEKADARSARLNPDDASFSPRSVRGKSADRNRVELGVKLKNPDSYPTLSVQEAAQAFGKAKSTIYRWLEQGKLTSTRARGRILTKSVNRLLRANPKV